MKPAGLGACNVDDIVNVVSPGHSDVKTDLSEETEERKRLCSLRRNEMNGEEKEKQGERR